MSVIDLIFDGNIYPAEQAVPEVPEYRDICRQVADMGDKLAGEMTKKEYDEIEKMLDLVAVEQDLNNKECFRYGFGMGMLLMQEVMQLRYFGNRKAEKTGQEEDTNGSCAK